jgi:signal transduction histidine kinase
MAVLAAIADGVVLANEHNAVVIANQAARRMLQLGSTEDAAFVGQPVSTLFAACSPESQAELRQAIDSTAAYWIAAATQGEAGAASANHSGQENASNQARSAPEERTDDEPAGCNDADRREAQEQAYNEPASVLLSYQERAIHASLTSMLDQQGGFAGTVIVLRDVTTEREVAQAKNDFVSLVSHELRTPMTSIKGYTDLLLKGAVGALNEQQRHFMAIVKSNVDRMSDLVSDLLDVSRIEAGRVRLEREDLDLTGVVHDVSEELAETLRQRELTLQLDLAPGLPRVYADRSRVIQVLLNLLSNAYRYTLAGGTITLAVHASDSEVQIDVTDTGIGIPEQVQETIFERFYRADHPVVRQQAGTGLGLPIAKSLIEMHGGRLWLCSEVDKGSTFSFALPLYKGA